MVIASEGSAYRVLAKIDRCHQRSGRANLTHFYTHGVRQTRRNAFSSVLTKAHLWSVKNSEALYNFEGWGAPYFLLGEECDGRVVVRPAGVCEAEIDQVEVDLYAAATAVRERLGSSGPLLFRFPDIACSQSAKLHSAFQSAALTWGLNSLHRGVLPVKCCHDASLLLSLVLAGAREGFGLEAGSKAELILCLAVLQKAQVMGGYHAMKKRNDCRNLDAHTLSASDYSLPTPFLICNGYKDGDYVGLAVQSAALRVNTFIVIEKPSDLQYYITAVGDLPRSAHRPFLGIRVRLTTGHSGHWGPTSGDNAKFGLCAKEMIWLVASLADESMLDCLRLLHFHVGSQVSNIATFKEAMRESTQMYAELVRLGAPMGFVDVGGGLGVEYHGSQGWGGQRSTNYDMQNYANDVVAALQDTIMRTGIKPPVLVTESGRAIVSAADVLIFEVVSTEPRGAMPSFDDEYPCHLNKGSTVSKVHVEDASLMKDLSSVEPSSFLLQNFQSILGSMTIINQPGQQNISKIQESLNDAIQFRQEADRLFKLGIMSLEGRAEAEELFSSIRSLALDFARTIPDTNIFPTEVGSLFMQIMKITRYIFERYRERSSHFLFCFIRVSLFCTACLPLKPFT